MNNLIKQAATAIYIYREENDDLIIDYLAQHDIDPSVCEELIRFLPIVFGRHMLSDTSITFSDEYIRFQADGTITSKGKLSDIGLYVAACDFISTHHVERDVYLAVALRSPEVDAANNALHGGAKFNNLVSGPVVIFDEPPTILGQRKAELFITREAKSLAKNKIWWKFWK